MSKYSPMGTFENNGANWRWITPNGLWNIINDEYDCIPQPYPSGEKQCIMGTNISVIIIMEQKMMEICSCRL